jgi:hypothetical protein
MVAHVFVGPEVEVQPHRLTVLLAKQRFDLGFKLDRFIACLHGQPRILDDSPMANNQNGIDPTVPPSGPGCVECLAGGGWWFHLRRCALCGHVGCCDSSPSQHASHHAADAGHPIIQSYEPGEDWFWNYATEEDFEGPELAPPRHHPLDQPTPGPAGRVPRDWQKRLH